MGGRQAQNARCTFRGGIAHVPEEMRFLYTLCAFARRYLLPTAYSTRAAAGNKKVGLFLLRVAGCSVLFY